MTSPGLVHLDARSFFSLKDGAFSPEDLARRAAELHMPAVALTDRDGLYGAARFVAACAREGVKPILGATLTVGGDHAGGKGGGRAGPWTRKPRSAGGRRRRDRAQEPTRALVDDGPQGRRARWSVGEPPPATAILLAQDERGYANLCQLITDAHLMGERGEPSLAPEQICAHPEGLLALLGPDSLPGRLAVAGRFDAARRAVEPYREAFGERLHVAVQHRMEANSGTEVRALLRFAEWIDARAVATNPVRYLVPQDAFLADALECMRQIVPVNRRNVSRINAEGYLKPAAEMRELFRERPDLADGTLELADACAFDLGLGQVHFPAFPTPAGRSAVSVLAERCWRGMERRGMEPTPRVRDRLDHELDMIRRMGFAAYFLNVADIVADIKAMGIRCACRGSAAGSLVCYLTGISDVDAVRHDLAFERFMNPLRDELPDIDVDVESARREDVYDMILSRYGQDRCACVAMVDTYRARSAIREVGKALGFPEVEVDTVAKAFPHIGAGDIRKAVEVLPELTGSNMNAGQLELLFRVAERLDGFPRHLALHPSGIVISNDDLIRRVPLERSFQGYRMIQADKDDVELLGYLKLDVLGVRMLSSMRHALDEIARTQGEKVDLDRIPLDDEPTFELIRASDTLGCFQIESPGQRELLQKLQPARWEDLIVDISLFRPGPVKSDMIGPFLRRRAGMERPVYLHPSFRPALQETFGVIVYHEQVIRTVVAVTGCDLSEADRVRRHLSDELEVDRIRDWFLERAMTNLALSDQDAERIWKEVWSFASFGFCKAHAAAFAVPTYQSAWLKTHYPAHFLAGVLTHDPGMYPRRLILEDARERGIPILPLDVNHSEREYVVEPVPVGPLAVGSLPADPAGGALLLPSAPLRSEPLPDSAARSTGPSATTATAAPANTYGIRLGLKDVHGISDAEMRSILEARADRPFRDVGDFLRRTKVARPVVEAIAHAGGFDALPSGTRRDRLYETMVTEPQREGDQLILDLWSATGGAQRDAVAPSGREPRGARDEGAGRGSRGAPVGSAASGARPSTGTHARPFSLPEYTDAERVRAELEVLGLDASRHLVSFFEPLLTDLGVVRSEDLWRHRSDAWVMVAGVKVASQTPAVRSGQRIVFLTLDDGTGPVDVTVFEKIQPKVVKTVFHAFVLAVWGRLRRTGVRGVSIIAEDVWDLVALQRARREGRLERALAEHTPAPGSSPRKFWHASGGSAGW